MNSLDVTELKKLAKGLRRGYSRMKKTRAD
jgi:hypothetical protein